MKKKKRVALTNLAMIWVSDLSPPICGVKMLYPKVSYCFLPLYILCLKTFPSQLESFNLRGNCYTTQLEA